MEDVGLIITYFDRMMRSSREGGTPWSIRRRSGSNGSPNVGQG